MKIQRFKLLFFVLIGLFACLKNYATPPITTNEQRIKVAMRMIGHQLLSASGDSTSRVLPIEQMERRYRIPFEADFPFLPEVLADIVYKALFLSDLSKEYIVEVESCATAQVLYSYQMPTWADSTEIACTGRSMPRDCYEVFLTLLDAPPISTEHTPTINDSATAQTPNSYVVILLLLGLFFASLFWSAYAKKRRLKTLIAPEPPPLPKVNPNVIIMGDYQFDKKTMVLSYHDQKTELTNKETDLLLLLHDAANEILEREHILQEVWGDEGSYVGRTLDVFISKLRKKLAADTNLKIVNIRGVGYKFVM